jgi:hypothetical protein
VARGADHPGDRSPRLRRGAGATIVIAIVNATIGPVLRFLFFPFTFLTLGFSCWF